ncbi:acyl-CoA dehydrogenase [Bordetella parapertussis]|uniref:Acyl-CoA dehydrogenase n=5 Tax=Bordetella TaxID=517 RepID=Q7WBX5_BORPA|nr:acyl-CoA dehydrogenase family protein [Bordetella parapertussis]AOB37891.1 acyl-CoA dehydrogenase [Bordetella parapertussis]AUL41860.1 acyl-CoA dehydrogenase [Bordetella parapertussis]AWP61774.1 acyl-CoA dehydrogenase [Bordetella parapertussis]AWP69272.1 acyl-CoA dehydrogenase [Bordetella parapertussis]AWP87864.1 acyl-CoA dehydrogenase [Bordetella parapertussis]
MDFTYTDEQQAVRDMVRAFARNEIAPIADECDRSESFSYDTWRRLAELGVINMNFPQDCGGSEAGMLAMCLAVEEVCYHDSSYGPVFTAQQTCCRHILRYANEPQRSQWIEEYVLPISRGVAFGATALTEPNSSSSDAASMSTFARRDGDEWVINGNKMYSTAAGLEGAKFVIVWAIVDKQTRKSGLFLVPYGTPGFTVGSKLHKMGMRAADTRELFFTDCRIPAAHILNGGAAGQASPFKSDTQYHSKLFLASNAIGLQRYCLDQAIDFAKQRKTWGVPLSERQRIQGWIAEMVADIQISTLLRDRAAVLYEAGTLSAADSAILKYVSAENAVKASHYASEIFGGMGYMDGVGVSRRYRDAKGLTIIQGGSTLFKWIIAQETLREAG